MCWGGIRELRSGHFLVDDPTIFVCRKKKMIIASDNRKLKPQACSSRPGDIAKNVIHSFHT